MTDYKSIHDDLMQRYQTAPENMSPIERDVAECKTLADIEKVIAKHTRMSRADAKGFTNKAVKLLKTEGDLRETLRTFAKAL